MSFVMTVPEVLGTAAGSLAGIGSSIDTANAAAAAQTTGLLPAARGLGGNRGAVLQPWSGVSVAQRGAAAFHGQVVRQLTAATQSYVAA